MKNVKVISVPLWQGGASKGVGKGLDALKKLKSDFVIKTNNETGETKDGIKNKEIVLKYNQKLYDLLNSELDKDVFPLIIGGDHSISLGSIAAVSNHHKKVTVIYIDAHGDLNTPDSSPSKNSHGMTLAALLNVGDNDFVNFGFTGEKISFDNLILFGIRDLDSGEVDLINNKNIKTYMFDDIRNKGLDNTLLRISSNMYVFILLIIKT